MGCFSYKCQKCNRGVNSNSFDGEDCVIFFLVKGKVVEKMSGRYDSYGRVFKDDFSTHKLLVKPIGEIDDHDKNAKDRYEVWEYTKWVDMVDLHFNKDEGTGWAIFHRKCWDGKDPEVISEEDENQGWGKIQKE